MGNQQRKNRKANGKKNASQNIRNPKNIRLNRLLSDEVMEGRIPFVGMTIDTDENGIHIATDKQYSVQDDTSGLLCVKIVPRNLIDRIKSVSNVFALGGPFKDKVHAKRGKDSWPQSWSFLTPAQLEDLKQKGFMVNRYIMMESIAAINFGEFIYTKTDISRFLEMYSEVAWVDYGVRQQLEEFDKMYTSQYVAGKSDFEFSPFMAKCWITLENCVFRISGLWDKLIEHLIPLYFFGATMDELKQQDRKFNRKQLIDRVKQAHGFNSDQSAYFDLLIEAALKYESSSFHQLRNDIAHKYVYRPKGIAPGGNNRNTPNSIEELHKEILEQVSSVREALVIFTAVMMNKTPKNSVSKL